MKHNADDNEEIKLSLDGRARRVNAGLPAASLYHCLIFIEDYGLYQFFDGNKSSFSTDNPCKDNKTKVAVISKNIYVSDIAGNNNKNAPAGDSRHTFKKSINFKYIKQYYKNKSYFLFERDTGKYGIYHTSPANIKKYYSLGIVEIVIPYEYLVVLFLDYKFAAIAERQRIKGQSCILFIEETDKIYKAVAVVNGLNILQVMSFKEDMLDENLNFLQAELNSKKIKIDKIFTNNRNINAALNGLFLGAEIISFDIREFFDFFNDIEPDSTSHFENLENRIKELKRKRSIRNNLFLAGLLIALILIIAGITGLNNIVTIKRDKITHLNHKIAILNRTISDLKAKAYMNKMLTAPDIGSYLKKLIAILPKDTKIKNIIITRSKNDYILRGKGVFSGGYGEFVKDYNEISEKLSAFKMFGISFNINKFDKPSFRFSVVIK